ncbi:MAG: 16S rRNA (adenine(1518)-N(6)/adenine(1519)-N(6))-dimethyltransferase RsmA [Candidatus Paceibacterota bacterium]|jgi:16S rRNA (adenine1518-N6/adenine1519-N6)-dimethyltransferase
MRIKAKKSLGQNFLKSKSVAGVIVDAGDIHAGDIVLEIGPGKGILTEKLVILAGKVIAIEKDDNLSLFLKEKFVKESKNGRIDIVNKDILDFDPKILKFYGKTYKIVANIPYYITGLLFRKFLESDFQPEKMVFLVQKEVAMRIMARDPRHGGASNKESLLSISVKAYGEPKFIKKVPARYFSPEPKVDSAVLLVDNISKKHFKNIDENRFFEILKSGFAHKRKVLIKNLESITKDKEKLREIFLKNNIPEKTRAENLTLDNWLKITKEIKISFIK